MKKNNDESLNSVGKIVELLATGDYKIDEMHFANHDENTRFVIFEKYPEKNKGVMYINVKVTKPIQYISTTFTVYKSGEIEY